MCKNSPAPVPAPAPAVTLDDVHDVVRAALVGGLDVRDVRAAVSKAGAVAGLRDGLVWEAITTADCAVCGGTCNGVRAAHSLSYVKASRSSARSSKRAEVCGVCLDALFARAANGERAVYKCGRDTDGVEVTLRIYAPRKPWERNGVPNLHGVCYDMHALPVWGTAKSGVYWEVTFIGSDWHGYLISLYNTGYNPWVWVSVKGANGVSSLPKARYGSKAALWEAIKGLRATVA